MQGHSFPLDKVNRENPRMPKRSHPLSAVGLTTENRRESTLPPGLGG